MEISAEKEIKIIIIGSGAAGVYAADNIRKNNKNAIIEMITNDKYMPYFRPSIPDILIKEINDNDLEIKNPEWYKDNNIQVTLNSEVAKIETAEYKIILDNGTIKKYNKLILANGARGFVPPIQNVNLKGVFVLRSREDAENIKKYAMKSKKAVVIGGGVLGLEAAWELKKIVQHVEIVEAEKRILPRQLDNEGSELFEKILNREDVKFNKGHFVKSLIGDKEVKSVQLEDGTTIETDIVIISAGIKANKEITEGTDIKVNRGIIVNEKMETNIADIYACGDVAEHEGIIMGLWSPAVDQGKTAGINAVGGEAIYQPLIHPVTFSGMNTSIFSMGNIDNNDEKDEKLSYYDGSKCVYRKICYRDSIISGGILIGDTSKSGVILRGIRGKHTKDKIEKSFQ